MISETNIDFLSDKTNFYIATYRPKSYVWINMSIYLLMTFSYMGWYYLDIYWDVRIYVEMLSNLDIGDHVICPQAHVVDRLKLLNL